MYRAQSLARFSDPSFESRPGTSQNQYVADDSELGEEEVAVENLRRRNDQKLQSRFESIFAKYGCDFGEASDEIDLVTGAVVVNNGHLRHMRHERDVGHMPLRRSRNEMPVRAAGLIEADDELVLSVPRKELVLCQASDEDTEYDGSDSSENYNSNMPEDLAVEVVQNAVPKKSRINTNDPEFIRAFNRNIVKEVTRVMQRFQTPQTRFHGSSIPRYRQENVHSSPMHHEVQWDSSRDSSPDCNKFQQQIPSDSHISPIRLEPSLWDSDVQDNSEVSVRSATIMKPGWISWSEEEDRMLVDLRVKEQLTAREISQRIWPRSFMAIRSRLYRLSSVILSEKKAVNGARPSTSSDTAGASGGSKHADICTGPQSGAHYDLSSRSKTKYISPRQWNIPDDKISVQTIAEKDFSHPSSYYGVSSGELREGNIPLLSPVDSPIRRRGAKKQNTPIRAEEDQLIVSLREERRLSWKEIATYLPELSYENISHRYNSELKANARKPRYRSASPELEIEGTPWSTAPFSLKRKRSLTPHSIPKSSLPTAKWNISTEKESVETSSENEEPAIVASADDRGGIKTSTQPKMKYSRTRRRTWDERAHDILKSASEERSRLQSHKGGHLRRKPSDSRLAHSQSLNASKDFRLVETSPAFCAEPYNHSTTNKAGKTSYPVVIVDVPTGHVSGLSQCRSESKPAPAQAVGLDEMQKVSGDCSNSTKEHASIKEARPLSQPGKKPSEDDTKPSEKKHVGTIMNSTLRDQDNESTVQDLIRSSSPSSNGPGAHTDAAGVSTPKPASTVTPVGTIVSAAREIKEHPADDGDFGSEDELAH